MDLDSIPDSCDSCPYVFNPSQNVEGCRREEEVCLAELAAGVLWSPTPAGAVDSKPCPPPLAGGWGGGREGGSGRREEGGRVGESVGAV